MVEAVLVTDEHAGITAGAVVAGVVVEVTPVVVDAPVVVTSGGNSILLPLLLAITPTVTEMITSDPSNMTVTMTLVVHGDCIFLPVAFQRYK